MNILNIENISKIYGEKVIFDHASFGIQEGDKIGIIGINGTGKTTLLKMAAGLEEPDEGQIIKQNNLRIAYLPQNPQFPENATILSYIQDSEQQWKIESNLNKLGILEYDTPIEYLSGGQRQRMTIARAVVKKPDILILDDSASALDFATDAKLRMAIRDMENKATVFIVSQRAASIMYADKIIVLDDGQIVGMGTHEELLKQCEVYQEIYYSQFKKTEDEKEGR